MDTKMIECSFCKTFNPSLRCKCPMSQPIKTIKNIMPPHLLKSIVFMPEFPQTEKFENIGLSTRAIVHFQCSNCPRVVISRGSSSHRKKIPWVINNKFVCYACWQETQPKKAVMFQVSKTELEILALFNFTHPTLLVVNSYQVTNVIRNKNRIDFYFPAAQIALEIDPYYTHKKRKEKDLQIFTQLLRVSEFKEVFRMRSHLLMDINPPSNYIAVESLQGPLKEASSIDYHREISKLLENQGFTQEVGLDVDSRESVLLAAESSWREKRNEYVNKKPLVDRSGYKRPFKIKKCTNPHCCKTFETRAKKTTFCSNACAATMREVAKKQKITQEDSILATHPEVAACFLQNYTNPSLGTKSLTKGSRDYCEFMCECGYHAQKVQVGTFLYNYYNQHVATHRHKYWLQHGVPSEHVIKRTVV